MKKPVDFAALLKDSLVAAVIAAILFVPIIGMVLNVYSLQFELARAGICTAAVFVGRFAMGFAVQSGLLDGVRAALSPISRASEWLGQASGRHERAFIVGVLAALVVIPFLPFTSNYLMHVITQTFIYVLLAMGLNIVVGLAGLLDLGFVAFYAVGAYAYALLALHLNISFWVAIPIAAVLAAMAGCVLAFPVLRMHGDYLAIVTLGFGEIIRILLTNLVPITGGPNGLYAPRPTFFGLVFSADAPEGSKTFHQMLGIAYDPSYRYIFMYFIVLVFAAAGTWVFKRLREMPVGRAWEALREDEVACKALGINPVTTKLSAFTLGATFGGIGGVFFAGAEGFINPTSFNFIESALILAIVVLGGMGSIVGVILAAVCITLLPEVFREFGNFRMLVFGLAMVFIMIWRPTGLLRVQRRTFTKAPNAT